MLVHHDYDTEELQTIPGNLCSFLLRYERIKILVKNSDHAEKRNNSFKHFSLDVITTIASFQAMFPIQLITVTNKLAVWVSGAVTSPFVMTLKIDISLYDKLSIFFNLK